MNRRKGIVGFASIRSGGLGIVLVVLVHGFTWTVLSADPFSEAAPEQSGKRADDKHLPYEPDHLVPTNSNPGDSHVRYTEALRKQLNLDAPFFARMLVMPSFGGEISLRLHAKNGVRDLVKVDQFLLTCHTADKSIWYSLPENNEEKKPQSVIVAVTSAPIPGATARRLCLLWDRMLLRSRPPEQPNTGCDGVTIEFATPLKRGETWTPMQRKSPSLFVGLGNSLVDYCATKPDRRKVLLEGIERRIQGLDTYLNEHPAK